GKIQNSYRSYLARQQANRLRKQQENLLRLMLRLLNNKDLIKQAAFNLWRANINAKKLNDSSIIIQNFMGDIDKKLKARKEMKKRHNITKGVNILSNWKCFLREPFNMIKSESNRKIFDQMKDDLDNKRKDHLKNAMKKIKDEEARRLLNRLFGIPENLKKKVLKKAMDKWRNNARNSAENEAAERIQRNYKWYWERMRNSKMMKRIYEIFSKLSTKNSDWLNYYFNLWKKNCQKQKVLRSAKKIDRFLHEKVNDRRAIKNWHKWSDLLNMNNHNYEALDLLKRVRKLMAINKWVKPIEHRIKQDEMDDLKEMYNKSKGRDFLKKLFDDFENRDNWLSLKSAFKLWRNNAHKLTERLDAVRNTVELIKNRKNFIAADTANSVCLVKKLFDAIPKIRAKDFYDRLRRNAEMKNKIEETSKALLKANHDWSEQNKNIFVKKVYKLYIYRKLSKLFTCCDDHLKYKIKPNVSREFIQKLFDNLQRSLYFNYNGSKSSEFKCKQTKVGFRAKAINPKNLIDELDPNRKIKAVVP
ncbi:MAG: hypothetical protein ACRC42_00040, partial [Mycoplasma sp.]